MKLLFVIIGIGLFSLTCVVPLKLNQQTSEEYLINTQYKIIYQGYFHFLKLNNAIPIKEITFYYYINKKNNTFSVSLLKKKEVSPQYNIKYFESSEKWNSVELNSYREKYYKVIDENFLNMSNKDKFELFDSLAIYFNK